MKKKDDDAPQQQSASSNPFSALLDTVASCTVPHDWFCSFYFLSLSLCAFWPGEILGLQGPLWRMFRDYTPTSSLSMTFPQLQTTWAMLFAQSARRLYECLDLPSSSESQMFVGHWVMGIAFYAATSVAVWVEGIGKSMQTVVQPALRLIGQKPFALTLRPRKTLSCEHPHFARSSASSFFCSRPVFNTMSTPTSPT